MALLKGRANYVCHFHLERTLQNGRLTSREDVGYLREISRFMKTTSSGDKAELSKVPENALVWNLVTSTRETCLGAECQYYQDCFVMKARKEAQRVPVSLGRSSVNTIEVVDGLKVGDQVILSDMSASDNYDRVRLE